MIKLEDLPNNVYVSLYHLDFVLDNEYIDFATLRHKESEFAILVTPEGVTFNMPLNTLVELVQYLH